MNENINDQEKDIKPVRPGEVSNRDKRVTKGGGVLFSSMLIITIRENQLSKDIVKSDNTKVGKMPNGVPVII